MVMELVFVLCVHIVARELAWLLGTECGRYSSPVGILGMLVDVKYIN